jgi:hypothetical protein
VYGKKAQRSEPGEWGVGDCIRGDATVEATGTDATLGRATTLGFRNAGMADPTRRFGLPSVRTDIKPRNLSIAAAMDFGNGTSAALLLGPCAYADLGVGEEDFLRATPPARLRALFERIGTRMADAEFACIYNHVRCRRRAPTRAPSSRGRKCSPPPPPPHTHPSLDRSHPTGGADGRAHPRGQRVRAGVPRRLERGGAWKGGGERAGVVHRGAGAAAKGGGVVKTTKRKKYSPVLLSF